MTTVTDEFPTYAVEAARCVAEGHVTVEWPLVGKRLCRVCGRTVRAHVCCGCGGLCDANEPCPMQGNCTCRSEIGARVQPKPGEWIQ